MMQIILALTTPLAASCTTFWMQPFNSGMPVDQTNKSTAQDL
jgi:hypothetical protein